MAWLEIHQTLPLHRKTMHLAALLGIPRAYATGLMVTFWLWALDNTPTGDLDNLPPGLIEMAAQWEGEEGALLGAMIEVGFVDKDDTGIRIHDWQDYAGKLIARREKALDRMRNARDAHNKKKTSANDTRTIREQVANDTRTEREQNANDTQVICERSVLQYSTVPKDIKHICSSGDEQDIDSIDSIDSSPSKSPQEDKPPTYEQIIDVSFPEFWEQYPRKKSKGDAKKAFAAVIKATPMKRMAATLKNLEAHLYSYLDEIEVREIEEQYIKYPGPWLRAQDFTEPPEVKGNVGG